VDESVGVDQEVLLAVRRARSEFRASVAPLREALHRYCRRLTGNVWDAEDLLQETLARAFAQAGRTHRPIENAMAWLTRIATNAYVDTWRRPPPIPATLPERAAEPVPDPLEVRDALAEVTVLLPPQERAAVVLKDVFDLPLSEIASMLDTTIGAVKSALHRGRGRLADPRAPRRPVPDRVVLDRLAEAFTAYDLARLAALFTMDAVSDVIGAVHEIGRESLRTGSLHHTLVLEADVRYRAEVTELDGEPLILLWETPTDGSGPVAVGDVLRVETRDGEVSRLRWYYFCPQTLTEVAARLGHPVHTH
jgi:RNA polymerase sigma-70 factor (ECF subfamily)